MITHTYPARTEQRGIVLVSSLLLLLVVTIIALSMFRSFGIQEKIAGNMREKQRALQAAVSVQQYAEWWLTTPTGSTTPTTVCSAPENANLGEGQICTLPPSNVTTVPWAIGVSYTPSGMAVGSSTGLLNNPSYYGAPTFYITDIGPSVDASIPGEIYKVDAMAYGGNSNTVAVVESTFAVYSSSANRTL